MKTAPFMNWHMIWIYDDPTMTLRTRTDRDYIPGIRLEEYDIDLADVHTSAQMLDWIYQVQTKTWANSVVIGALVHAFYDLFHPQNSLCSFGSSKTIDDPASVVRENVKRIEFSRAYFIP